MEKLPGAIVTESGGIRPAKFFVVNESDIIQKQHLQGRFYEIEELDIIKEYFKKNTIFLDIGANVGNHAVYVAKFLCAREVMAVEPNPEALAILEINTLLNGMSSIIKILNFGISDETAVAAAVTQPDNLGGTELKLGAGDIVVKNGDEAFPDLSPSFVKIDVEGMEMKVLAGLRALIGRCRPDIFIEVHVNQQPDFSRWCKENSYQVARSYKRYRWNENFLVQLSNGRTEWLRVTYEADLPC